jgi:hypothetical protein
MELDGSAKTTQISLGRTQEALNHAIVAVLEETANAIRVHVFHQITGSYNQRIRMKLIPSISNAYR